MSSAKNKKQIVRESKNTPVAKNIVENRVAQSAKELESRLVSIESIRWILTIFCTLFVFVIVAVLIHNNYHPDTSVLTETANKLLAQPTLAHPKPVEAMIFRVGIFVVLFSIAGFYSLFSKAKFVKLLAQKSAFLLLSAASLCALAALIYCDFAAKNPFGTASKEQPQNSRDYVGTTNFDFYFNGLFLGNYLLMYLVIIVPLIACLFFLGIKKYNWEQSSLYNRIVNVVGYTVTGGVILAIVLMNTFYFPYTFENKYDFNAVYYSATQVYAGLPMLVNGFTNTYGLYAQLLNPIFQITGLSVFTFSLVMSLLLGATFIFNFYALQKFVRNKVVLFLGFLMAIFFSFLDPKFTTAFDSIFSQYPIRFIIPSVLALLATIYFLKRSRIVYLNTFIIMAFSILWNPELGTVCFLSWLAANTFNDFYTPGGKVAVKKIATHWILGAISIFVVFYAYKLTIYVCYGTMPDLSLLFSTPLVFGKIGFYLLPMVLVHPWNLMALTLIFGFTYSIVKWHKKDISPKTSFIFLLSLIGLGYFFYFQGRSHNWSFAGSTGFCIMLLTLLGDELWTITRKYNIFLFNGLFLVFLGLCSFAIFDTVANAGKLKDLVYQDDDKDNQAKEQERISANEKFIVSRSAKGEKVFIFSGMPSQGLYYNGNKRRAPFNPGIEDMFLSSDVDRMERIISDSSFKVFIEPMLCTNPVLAGPLAAIAASYEVKDTIPSMAILQKRTTPIPVTSFFRENAIVHKKYSDDTAGLKMRISDALGIAPISMANTFSIELLFKSSTQLYQFATLAGNMDDTSGFIIARIMNTPNFFFGFNGKGFTLPFPNSDWHYCVLNVYPDHIEVYDNGSLLVRQPLAQPVHSSPERFFIGNLSFMRNYLGAISEIAINAGPVDEGKVQLTWKEIAAAIANPKK